MAEDAVLRRAVLVAARIRPEIEPGIASSHRPPLLVARQAALHRIRGMPRARVPALARPVTVDALTEPRGRLVIERPARIVIDDARPIHRVTLEAARRHLMRVELRRRVPPCIAAQPRRRVTRAAVEARA